jgi:hypothetical protein
MIDIEFRNGLRPSAPLVFPRIIKGTDKSDHRDKRDQDQYQITQLNLQGIFLN